MKNREKYKNEIVRTISQNDDLCKDLIEPIILKSFGFDCEISCPDCYILQKIWMEDEYQEPETDWSKVAVDTQVLVRDGDEETWKRRYFAQYASEKVWAWNYGRTSWTAHGNYEYDACPWNQAKLAEGSEDN